jgi:hypothetical protein
MQCPSGAPYSQESLGKGRQPRRLPDPDGEASPQHREARPGCPRQRRRPNWCLRHRHSGRLWRGGHARPAARAGARLAVAVDTPPACLKKPAQTRVGGTYVHIDETASRGRPLGRRACRGLRQRRTRGASVNLTEKIVMRPVARSDDRLRAMGRRIKRCHPVRSPALYGPADGAARPACRVGCGLFLRAIKKGRAARSALIASTCSL